MAVRLLIRCTFVVIYHGYIDVMLRLKEVVRVYYRQKCKGSS